MGYKNCGLIIVRHFMRLHPQILRLSLLLLLFTQGCVMSTRRQFAEFRIPGQDEEPSYREVAMEFVRFAQAGDVERMIEITSPLMYSTDAHYTIRTGYTERIIPRLRGTDVTWDSHGRPFTDDQYNAGLMFTGTAHGQKSFSFDLMVEKENGKLVIMNTREHHWYNR